MSSRSLPIRRLLLPALFCLFVPAAEASWYDADWLYRKPLTLNGALVTGTQTNFPVLVSWTADTDLASRARNDGDDILFTSSDGVTKLDHEIESFNGTTGGLIAWVRVPSLPAGVPTTLYLYYGNGVASSQQNPTGVWSPTYDAVWHLGGSLQDSTSSNNDGTASGGTTVVAGAVGSARSFDGVDDYIYTANGADISYSNLTVEAWVRTSSAAGVPIVVWEGVDQQGTANGIWDAGIYVDTAADLRFYVWGSGGHFPTAAGPYNDDVWHHVVGVSYAFIGQTYIYVDGVLRGTDTHENTLSGVHYWRIGAYKNASHPNGADGYFNGRVDEVRIGSGVASPSWIATSYNNQANQGVGPGKFVTTAASQETTFGAAGVPGCVVTTPVGTGDDHAYGVAVQADGNIVLSGYFDRAAPQYRDFLALRYNAHLRLDASFDGDGIATLDVWGNDEAEGILIQPDGKIVLGGRDNVGGIFGCCDEFVVARFNPDGTPDTGFGVPPQGYENTNIGGSWDLGRTVARQTDGKLVLGGYVDDGAGNWNLSVVRYNGDGSVDTTFNPAGAFGLPPNAIGMVVTSVSAGDDWGNSILVQPDGKIVLAGGTWNGSNYDFAIVRYNANGSLDTAGFNPTGTFGGPPNLPGMVVTPVRSADDWGNSIALQTDGKIVFGGKSNNGTDIDFAVVRYNTDGSLDGAFGTGGKAFAPIGPGDDDGEAIALQTDGKIVQVGYTFNGSDTDFALVRYNGNGTLDASFGAGGKVTTPVGAANDAGYGVAIQPDGKILAVGEADTGPTLDVAAARYNADGTLDQSCGVHYRSIGTAANYSTGTVTATQGSAVVTGSVGVDWVAANRGRGDRINIDGVDYFVLAVDAPTQLRLAIPYLGTTAPGLPYVIARQFVTLSAWEDCVDGPGNGGSCAPFPEATPSLVADDRAEVGIAYEDSAFSENLVFNGASTDAKHSIRLTVDPGNRHNGVAGSGAVLNGSGAAAAVEIADDYVSVEWLEITGGTVGIDVNSLTAGANRVVVRGNLIHNSNGAAIYPETSNAIMDIYNNFLYDNAEDGIWMDPGAWAASAALRIWNNTIYNNLHWGIVSSAGSNPNVTLRNNICKSNAFGDFNVPSADGDYNLSGDGSAPGANSLWNVPLTGAGGVNFVSTALPRNLHLLGTSSAIDRGATSALFSFDIDGGARTGAWDIGADETGATTAVELVSFSATPFSGAVSLDWETGSELANLGFHLYRSAGGDIERITSSLIPGLGSSPQGARYHYLDAAVTNGVTYSYFLEDVDTTGRRERRGPVEATPLPTLPVASSGEDGPSRVTVGEPSLNGLRVSAQGRDQVVLVLRTEGFFAYPEEDGRVRIEVPGFVDTGAELPLRREWIDALAGRKVEIVSLREGRVEMFDFVASRNALEAVGSRDGTVRLRRGSRTRPAAATAASIADVVLQGETKRALIAMAPLRVVGDGLQLARDLEVTLSFRRPDASERAFAGGARGRRRQVDLARRGVVARLAAREPGLYGVRLADLLGRHRGAATSVRLSRLGETVAAHREGGKLFFLSEGAGANPYGNEAVYEVELATGEVMARVEGALEGEVASYFRHRVVVEENRLYGAGLLDAEDLWQWDAILSGNSRRFSFPVEFLVANAEGARIEIFLQGGSDFPVEPDHHVRALVNGVLLGEARWDGKTPKALVLEIPPGVVSDGENTLEIENEADTGASYSMVYLDRFAVTYPRASEPRGGRSPLTGQAALSTPSYVLDVTGAKPRWVSSPGTLRFPVEEGQSYLAVPGAEVRAPEILPVGPVRWRKKGRQADYLALGPSEFLDAARPLLERRSAQGLSVAFVPIEELFAEFGYGERRPQALRDFLRYAYHFWQAPSPRYLLLLGDGTYDFKDYLKSGAENRVPPYPVKTSFLVTASDSAYGSVNGEDLVPDIAVGRLPAASAEELRRMVEKILSFERAGRGLEGTSVLVTDNPDSAGDFDANGDELESTVLSGRTTRRISLARLGVDTSRQAVLDAFDDGASTLSYVGHGGIHLWASENIFDKDSTASLSPQSEQPIVLTLNCLNGYFHFPYFDSLSEALLKANGKGAVAVFSPSGLSVNEPAHELHRALLQSLLSDRHLTLGDAILEAQGRFLTRSGSPELLAIYHLFGDPGMVLSNFSP